MKRSGADSPKLAGLAQRLGLRKWGAAGLLEMLWHFTAKHAIQGDVGKWSDEEIAGALDWPPDDAARLIGAFVASRWVDEHPVHRLVVHDWHEHADESTKKTVANKRLAFASLDRPVSRPTLPGSDSFSIESETCGTKSESTPTSSNPFPTDSESFSTGPEAVGPSQSQSQSQSQSHTTSPNGDSRDVAITSSDPLRTQQRLGDGLPEAVIEPAAFQARWNAIEGVQPCRSMTERRRKALAARCRDPAWMSNLAAALARIAKSSFCRGGGDRGWRADVSWFLKPDTLTEILEGKFDDRRSANGAPQDAAGTGRVRHRDWTALDNRPESSANDAGASCAPAAGSGP